MKYLHYIITLALALTIGIAKAGEGMWIPMLLQYNEKEMQEMGIHMPSPALAMPMVSAKAKVMM